MQIPLDMDEHLETGSSKGTLNLGKDLRNQVIPHYSVMCVSEINNENKLVFWRDHIRNLDLIGLMGGLNSGGVSSEVLKTIEFKPLKDYGFKYLTTTVLVKNIED